MRRTFRLLILAVALMAAGCNSGDDVPRPEMTELAGTATAGLILATGTLDLAAATAFGEPGFHETLLAQACATPADRARNARSNTHFRAVRRSIGQPGRPNVTPDGVFDNRVVVELVTGVLTLFLHEDGELATEPEPFKPG